MELYTFDNQKIDDDYSKLLAIYSKEDRPYEKVRMFEELVSFNRFLKRKKSVRHLKPDNYNSVLQEEIDNHVKACKDINPLTSELCFYWGEFLRSASKSYNIVNPSLTKEEYYTEIESFFTNNFEEDLSLVKDAFDRKRIQVKSFFNQKESSLLLRDINDYYIKILYKKNLDLETVKNTIHEFGHVSEFLAAGKESSFDHVMEEVVATVYELLYISSKTENDKDLMLEEFTKLFNTYTINYLENYYSRDNCRYIYPFTFLVDRISFMYASIVAFLLYLRKDDSDFKLKMDYLKKNNPHLPFLELLKKIGITEEELVYTTKNAKKLIR